MRRRSRSWCAKKLQRARAHLARRVRWFAARQFLRRHSGRSNRRCCWCGQRRRLRTARRPRHPAQCAAQRTPVDVRGGRPCAALGAAAALSQRPRRLRTSLGATDSNFSRCGSSPESVRPIHRSKHSMTIRDSLRPLAQRHRQGARSIRTRLPRTALLCRRSAGPATRCRHWARASRDDDGLTCWVACLVPRSAPSQRGPAPAREGAAPAANGARRPTSASAATSAAPSGVWPPAAGRRRARCSRTSSVARSAATPWRSRSGTVIDFYAAIHRACCVIAVCASPEARGSRRMHGLARRARHVRVRARGDRRLRGAPRRSADARSSIGAARRLGRHAVAHVMEMQNRRRDGVAWLAARLASA